MLGNSRWLAWDVDVIFWDMQSSWEQACYQLQQMVQESGVQEGLLFHSFKNEYFVVSQLVEHSNGSRRLLILMLSASNSVSSSTPTFAQTTPSPSPLAAILLPAMARAGLVATSVLFHSSAGRFPSNRSVTLISNMNGNHRKMRHWNDNNVKILPQIRPCMSIQPMHCPLESTM